MRGEKNFTRGCVNLAPHSAGSRNLFKDSNVDLDYSTYKRISLIGGESASGGNKRILGGGNGQNGGRGF